MTLNLQLKKLGNYFPAVAGGTSSYTSRLLSRIPALGSYALSGYYLSWVALISINSIVLTDLIKIHTDAAGVSCPVLLLRIGFTVIPFVLAFAGIRALAILHLFFMVPTIGLMLLFVVQGLGWLAFAPNSPGFFPAELPSITPLDWVKWYFIAVYAVYATEGGAAFIADGQQPKYVQRCLSITAGFLPVVYLGGSWIVSRLATDASAGDSAFANLLSAATPFWGQSASLWITALIGFTQLLSSSTTVSLCARVIYQASLDGYAAPVFRVVSRQGSLTPALVASLILSVGCLVWGDVVRIIFITGTGYIFSMMTFHLGIWLNARKEECRWPFWSLGCFLVEAIVLLVGGIAWNWQDFLLGLFIPAALLVADRLLRQINLIWLKPQWWQKHLQNYQPKRVKDFLFLQVNWLLVLVCTATILGWLVRSYLDGTSTSFSYSEILVLLVMSVGFVMVAIATWTSLPQISAIAEAEELIQQQAKDLEFSLQELKNTQIQLIQNEKMISLGQLVAGVAHEINNPINFIYGNIVPARQYVQDLLDLIQLYNLNYPDPALEISQKIEDVDLEFIQEDLPKLLTSMQLGADRVRQIVLSLRNFSRLDETSLKAVDIHEGMDSTLLILQSRIKVKSDRPEISIIKNYGTLPPVECYASQLNQVFMNIIANAIDALEDKTNINSKPTITISTLETLEHQIKISIADNGSGLPESIKQQIFDPFFTTKSVGKGTGLGLSISYQIIHQKHGGSLECISSMGQGTEFIIQIPAKQIASK